MGVRGRASVGRLWLVAVDLLVGARGTLAVGIAVAVCGGMVAVIGTAVGVRVAVAVLVVGIFVRVGPLVAVANVVLVPVAVRGAVFVAVVAVVGVFGRLGVAVRVGVLVGGTVGVVVLDAVALGVLGTIHSYAPTSTLAPCGTRTSSRSMRYGDCAMAIPASMPRLLDWGCKSKDATFIHCGFAIRSVAFTSPPVGNHTLGRPSAFQNKLWLSSAR